MTTLLGLWLLWCTMHSLLITPVVITGAERLLAGWFRAYRIGYNGLSLVTFLVLLHSTFSVGGEVLYCWQWPWQLVRYLGLALAFWLFWAGAGRYDMSRFLGVWQLRSGSKETAIAENVVFSPAGVFGVTRHPWYLASLFCLWTLLGAPRSAELLMMVVLSCYLFIGTLLEERKLVLAYGEQYRRYQQQVSMIIPWRWLAAGLVVLFRRLRKLE